MAANVEQTLTSLHLVEFAPTVRQVVPMPVPPTPAEVSEHREEFGRRATARIGLLRRSARQARAAAAGKADDLLRRRQVRAVIDAQRRQVDADETWAAVREHDRDVVVGIVDEALVGFGSEARCVDVGRDEGTGARYVTPIVVVDTMDVAVASRVTPSSTHRPPSRGETDRHEVYTRAIASTVLAVAKKALAVAAAADEVRVLAVRLDDDSAAAFAGLGVVYVGSFRRTDLAEVDWPAIDPVEILLAAPGARLVRRGRTKKVASLAIDDDGQLELLAEFARRLPEGTNRPSTEG